MNEPQTIESIMTKEVVTCDINQPLRDVNHLFATHHIRHMPILSEEALVGIISKTDIMRISFGNIFGDEEVDDDDEVFDMLSINQVMKHSPVTVEASTPIHEAARTFAQSEFHALPVTNNGKLVGILTTTDVIRYFMAKQDALA